jgi:high frequency lysogenization protein
MALNDNDRDRTLALAGMFQAAILAQQLARRGYEDEVAFNASVRSIFITDAINTLSVFGGIDGVRMGLRAVRDKFMARAQSRDFEIVRYVLALAQLQGRLRRQPEMMQEVSDRIAEINASLTESGDQAATGNRTCAELAAIYKDTISTLKPRIIVQGEQGHLASTVIVDKVRTALLAGIRAAFLWGQLGGRRWQLIFSRRAYIHCADAVLSQRSGAAG